MNPTSQRYADELEDTPSPQEAVASFLRRLQRNGVKQATYGMLTFTDCGNDLRHDWRVEIAPKSADLRKALPVRAEVSK